MENNLPTIAELTADIAVAYKTDQFNLLLNQQPPADWIKEHPYIKGHKYIPIDKVEHMLRRIFKRTRIEITGQGTSFNGVYVTVRVHYLHPVTNEWDYNDGIGACQLQTAKGTSPADLNNINNGALSMAFPIAKTLAVKDACDHFGSIFGSNLNRKDVIEFKTDKNLNMDWDSLNELYEMKKEKIGPDDQIHIERIIKGKESSSYNKVFKDLKKL
jgi:hypothetical protein